MGHLGSNITVRLSPELKERLRKLVLETGLSEADLIRMAVKEFVDKRQFDPVFTVMEFSVLNHIDNLKLTAMILELNRLVTKNIRLFELLTKRIDVATFEKLEKEAEDRHSRLVGDLQLEINKWQKIASFIEKGDFKQLKSYLDRLRFPLRSR